MPTYFESVGIILHSRHQNILRPSHNHQSVWILFAPCGHSAIFSLSSALALNAALGCLHVDFRRLVGQAPTLISSWWLREMLASPWPTFVIRRDGLWLVRRLRQNFVVERGRVCLGGRWPFRGPGFIRLVPHIVVYPSGQNQLRPNSISYSTLASSI